MPTFEGKMKYTNSLIIAALMGKEHKNVLAKLRKLNSGKSSFTINESYKDKRNGTHPVIGMDDKLLRAYIHSIHRHKERADAQAIYHLFFVRDTHPLLQRITQRLAFQLRNFPLLGRTLAPFLAP